MVVALEYTPKEVVDEYASIRNIYFGQVILDAMGYNAGCVSFCKCKSGGYNIHWMTRAGDEFRKTFYWEEIHEAFKGKTLDVSIKVSKNRGEKIA